MDKRKGEKEHKDREAPLSLYCSPLIALTVKVCESSSLGEMTAPAKGNVPLGFWCRDCSFTKYSSSPASLFNTKNLETAQKSKSVVLKHQASNATIQFTKSTYSTGSVPCPWSNTFPTHYLFSLLEHTHFNSGRAVHEPIICIRCVRTGRLH